MKTNLGMAGRLAAVVMAGAVMGGTAWGVTEPDEVFRFGAGARDVAMGKSMVAGARGVSALYWNPALLAEAGYREVQAFHAVLPEDFSYSYVGYAHPFRESVGFGAQVLRYGQNDGAIRDADNNETGTFSESQTGASLGAGLKGLFLANLDVGLSADALNRSLGGRSSLLSGLNAGGAYHFLERRGTVGVLAKNLLTMASGETTDRLPFRVDVGAAYEFFPGATVGLTFLDMKDVAAGLEWVVGRRLALRLGDAGGGDFSAGVGLLFQRLRVDVSMTPSSSDGVGSTLASSLSYTFGDDWTAVRRRSALKTEEKAREQLREGQWLASLGSLKKAVGMDPSNGTASGLLARLKPALEAARVTRSKHERELKSQPEWRLLRMGMNEQMEGTPLHGQILVAYAAMKRPEEYRYQSLLTHFEKASGFQVLTAEQKSLTPEAYVAQKRDKTAGYFAERNLGEALRECQEIVLLEPDSVADLERLGSLFYAIGQKDKAVEAFQRALKLDPKNKSIKQFMNEKKLKLKSKGD